MADGRSSLQLTDEYLLCSPFSVQGVCLSLRDKEEKLYGLQSWLNHSSRQAQVDYTTATSDEQPDLRTIRPHFEVSV